MQVTLTFPPDLLRQLAAEVVEVMRLSQFQLAQPTTSDPQLLTTDMVATRLRRCKKTVNSYIRAGRLNAANFGSLGKPDYRVSEKDCNDFYSMNCR